ncbi:hypothetical protein GIB67_031855 [Kingdonia uniflora]|uniref:S-acyltransferase n=1 Tax=Kingdonia uniflora TaxID=39325 RepID=A0A7J7L4M6_9MAGN|nr:hypothetical protein GIB67_031855 [Kingdonia uniflora]
MTTATSYSIQPEHRQVVAITVFFLLVIAFYAFFAPFLGGRILEYASIGIYTSVVLLVFILYVRCTAINPADPGILSKLECEVLGKPIANPLAGANLIGNFGSGAHSSPLSASGSSAAAKSSWKGSVGEIGRVDTIPVGQARRKSSSAFNKIGGFFCALFVHEDCCKPGGESTEQQQVAGEDALFCTLCNAEVASLIVYWFGDSVNTVEVVINVWMGLITIVGKKELHNFYSTHGYQSHLGIHQSHTTFHIVYLEVLPDHLIFVFLFSDCQLVIEAGVGIAVLVRCFVDKRDMENQITERLGDVFSRAPFATVVAIFSAVSLLACVPLVELFFFHMILIRKGITTYEYVVAMRAMSEAPAGASVDEEIPAILYSPSGSATTGLSGASSLGLQYKGAWCTPPRVFVDYQDEVVPHLEPGMVPSTVDPDAERGNKQPKRQVRLSAWKLAKLDSNEAMRAAAKARASSSVLRPVDNNNQRLRDTDFSSSGNMSCRSSMSTDLGGNKDPKSDPRFSPVRNSYAPSHDDYETGTQSASSFGSPNHIRESVALSPLPLEHPSGPFTNSRPSFQNHTNLNNPIFHSSTSVFDEKIMEKGVVSTADMLLQAPSTSLLRDNKRTSVIWDQEAGRYVSIPISARTSEITSEARNMRNSSQAVLTNPNLELSGGHGRRPTFPVPPEPSAPKGPSVQQQSENLMYTGESIFFGGPLLSVPSNDSSRKEVNAGLRLDYESRGRPNWPQETRGGKGMASNQFPVFIPRGTDMDRPSGS